jgi:hypothetical protein
MFLTSEDFTILPYNIPNIDGNVGFQKFVDENIEEILKELFGSSFYTSFLQGIYSNIEAETPIPEEDIEQKWKDLRDGKQYFINDFAYTWVGIKKLLKPYIYAMWTRANIDNDTGQGITAPDFENSQSISPAARICRAYNKFSAIAGNSCSTENTLFGFLVNSEDYEDDFDGNFANFAAYINFFFKDQDTMNLWNI